ncbi:MAG: OmpA family protein [Bacteroidia bacterium]|nr:OmpA family protein [Bacteroidia bacterium]
MKKSNLIFSLLTIMVVATFVACGAKKGSMQAAREALQKKEFAVAGENYKAVYSKTKNKDEKNEACFQTAECYYMANDMKNAEGWYKKTIKADSKNTEAQYKLAETIKAQGRFTDAIIEYNNYKKLAGAEKNVDAKLRGCELALKWKNEKTRYKVENVKSINSKWSDFAPMYYKKDQLYFTSDREKGASNKSYGWTANFFTDVYKVRLKIDKRNHNNIKYETPALVDKDKVNSNFNDGSAAFDSRGGTMYFTQCNGKKGEGKFCRIWTATLSGQEWTDVKPLEFSTDSFNSGHPSLTKDNQIMYFSSDMPGGHGGKDIWYVTYTKRSRTWGDPINLGPSINTDGDEVYPFIHDDGTLYFSSNGHVGIGAMDIFYATGSGTDWGTPVNMKSPINSGGDDFSIILSNDKESGYLASNREGTRGQDDIWRFHMEPLVFTLSGVARDFKTKQILANSFITITTSTDTGKVVIKTDAAGAYKVEVKPKTDIEVFGSHEDYLDSKIGFQTTKGLEVSADLIQDVDLTQFDYENAIRVEGIYYDLDKANIRPDAAKILDSLVFTLNKYPKLRIELGSHTDCRADSAYNQNLSQRRADSAVAYMIRQGIDAERLVANGYGERVLVNDCACEGSYVKRQCTEEEHQMNRRTTVKLLGNDFKPKPKEVPVDPKVKPGTKPTPQPRR